MQILSVHHHRLLNNSSSIFNTAEFVLCDTVDLKYVIISVRNIIIIILYIIYKFFFYHNFFSPFGLLQYCCVIICGRHVCVGHYRLASNTLTLTQPA